MILPTLIREFMRTIATTPSNPEAADLAQLLVERVETVCHLIDDPFLPVSLLSNEEYRQALHHLSHVRQHLQAHGLELMAVPTLPRDGVLLLVHQLQAQPTFGRSS